MQETTNTANSIPVNTIFTCVCGSVTQLENSINFKVQRNDGSFTLCGTLSNAIAKLHKTNNKKYWCANEQNVVVLD